MSEIIKPHYVKFPRDLEKIILEKKEKENRTFSNQVVTDLKKLYKLK